MKIKFKKNTESVSTQDKEFMRALKEAFDYKLLEWEVNGVIKYTCDEANVFTTKAKNIL